MCILINKISQNVTLDSRPHLLASALLSRGDIPPRLTFPNLLSHSLLVEFWFLHLHYRLSVIGLLSILGQGPRPNIYSWPLYSYKSHSHPHKSRLVHVFKQMFSVFKQHYTYFHILFYPYIFSKNTNNVIRTTLQSGPLFWHSDCLTLFLFFYFKLLSLKINKLYLVSAHGHIFAPQKSEKRYMVPKF